MSVNTGSLGYFDLSVPKNMTMTPMISINYLYEIYMSIQMNMSGEITISVAYMSNVLTIKFFK